MRWAPGQDSMQLSDDSKTSITHTAGNNISMCLQNVSRQQILCPKYFKIQNVSSKKTVCLDSIKMVLKSKWLKNPCLFDIWFDFCAILTLRIPDTYDAKIAKICNIWTFLLVTQLIDNLLKIRQKEQHWEKRRFAGFLKDGLLAELQARVSRGCIFFAIFAS